MYTVHDDEQRSNNLERKVRRISGLNLKSNFYHGFRVDRHCPVSGSFMFSLQSNADPLQLLYIVQLTPHTYRLSHIAFFR